MRCENETDSPPPFFFGCQVMIAQATSFLEVRHLVGNRGKDFSKQRHGDTDEPPLGNVTTDCFFALEARPVIIRILLLLLLFQREKRKTRRERFLPLAITLLFGFFSVTYGFFGKTSRKMVE